MYEFTTASITYKSGVHNLKCCKVNVFVVDYVSYTQIIVTLGAHV
jgi:hypothetical protein